VHSCCSFRWSFPTHVRSELTRVFIVGAHSTGSDRKRNAGTVVTSSESYGRGRAPNKIAEEFLSGKRSARSRIRRYRRPNALRFVENDSVFLFGPSCVHICFAPPTDRVGTRQVIFVLRISGYAARATFTENAAPTIKNVIVCAPGMYPQRGRRLDTRAR